MLHEVVCKIGGSRTPVDMELLLVYSVLDPIKMHVHRFGLALSNLFVGKTICRGIVNLDRGGRLWMAHFLKSVL